MQEFLKTKNLTPGQTDIVTLVCQGLSNKEIAEKRNISVQGVKDHLTRIYEKMSVKNRAQLIIACIPYLGGSCSL